ncbi:MAG: hypothetical protein LQ351_001886 [Letrouitia transgressa]|nr:MAG: hypothetical protein LQ351_001886 [Letrouitia transgressa]
MSQLSSLHLPHELWPHHVRKRSVKIEMGREFFVGSYTKAFLYLENVTMEQLSFRLPAGPKSGAISLCRDAEYNPERPDVMITIGACPGKYLFEVVDSECDIVLAYHSFIVSTNWRDKVNGPSLAFVGAREQYIPLPKDYRVGTNAVIPSAAPVPGGAPGDIVVEDWGRLTPANPHRIAIMLVDFKDGRFTTTGSTIQDIKTRWLNEIVNGIAVGGKTLSTAQWYREVSYGNFVIQATAFGVYNLPNNFADYFYTSSGSSFEFRADVLPQAAVTVAEGTSASDPLHVNWDNFETLLFVAQNQGSNFAWPYTNGATMTKADGTTTFYKSVVCMPSEWGASIRGDRTVRSTVSHETGHCIGLPDEYTPGVAGRNLGGWETMDSETDLPRFSGAEVTWLGFIAKERIRAKDFKQVSDETITLGPIEIGPDAANHPALIQIKMNSGQHYYVEYRSPQATQISDQSLPTPNAVLVTDVQIDTSEAPYSRPDILLVPSDEDGDGPVLTNGHDYHESVNGELRISASGIDASKADIHLQTQIIDKPDPGIRTWPAGPDRPWQSPDIEVRNAKNLNDSSWFNVPWLGHDNTVVAKIANNGGSAAPGVFADFFVKNYNIGGAPETKLGTDSHDIPAQGTVEFTTSWNPPRDGHFCIIVRIRPYHIPGTNPPVNEKDFTNDTAQSNYSRFISSTASPATREIIHVDVGNPFDQPLSVHIRTGQSNPLYRTYLSATSLRLQPKEIRTLTVMHEYDPSAPLHIPVSLVPKHAGGHRSTEIFIPPCLLPPCDRPAAHRAYHELVRAWEPQPNAASFAAFTFDPRGVQTAFEQGRPVGPRLLGTGIQNEIITGKATVFQSWYQDTIVDPRRVSGSYDFFGRVVVRSTERRDQPAQGVVGGKVIVLFTREGELPDVPKLTAQAAATVVLDKLYRTVDVDADGRFRVDFNGDAIVQRVQPNFAQATYVPAKGYGESESSKIGVAYQQIS